MRKKVLSIVAVQVLLTVTFDVLGHRAGAPAGSPAAVLAFAGVFALVGLFSVRIEFRRQQATFSLTEAVFVVALFVLGPIGTGVAGALGELAGKSSQRVQGIKIAFNAGNQLSAMTIAATGFWLVGWRDPTDPAAWFAALGAAVCFSLLNFASLTTVLALHEGRPFQEMFFDSVATGVLVTLASAPLGLIALDLFDRGVAGPLLLLPVIVAVARNNRDAAAQRDEHLRFERLYEAASRTARLVEFDDAVVRVAREAKELVTGTWAVAVAEDVTGEWVGAVVGPDGHHRAGEDVVAELLRLGRGADRELRAETLDPAARTVLPAGAAVVVASSVDGSPAPLVLAVFRDAVGEEAGDSRVQALAAFVTHATMAIGNARLLGEVEEALRQQVDLNRQKGDFVAAVSHELRTPLTAMLGSVGTVLRLEDRLDDDGRRRMLEMAKDQGNRLKRLIEELLTVAAAEHTAMDVRQEMIDVRRLLTDVRTELQALTGGRVVLDVDPGAAALVSDRLKLQQILLNLVENAGKYAPEGAIEVVARAAEGTTHVTVRDHGPGIPAADRARVFERFVQLDQSSTRRNGGTGLGLYLCHQLAEALGGRLVLDEAEGGGCAFTLSLPTGEGVGSQEQPARPWRALEGARGAR